MTSRIATVAAVGFLAATIWLSLRASDQPQLPPLPLYTRPSLIFWPEPAQLPEHTQSFSYSADGTRIFTFGYDIREWDAATLKPRARFVPEYRGKRWAQSYVFAPGEQTLVGFGGNPDRKPDTRLSVSAARLGDDTTVFVWQCGEREAKFVFKDASHTLGHTWGCPSHASSSDGRHLAIVGLRDIAVFDLVTGQEVARFKSKDKDDWFFDTKAWFTADGQSLVLFHYEDKKHWTEPGLNRVVVEQWKWSDPKAGREKVVTLEGVPSQITTISPDKRWLVGSLNWSERFNQHQVQYSTEVSRSHRSRDVTVWSLASGEKVATFDTGSEVVNFWFARDGSLWTLGTTGESDRYALRQWEVPTGRRLHEVPERIDTPAYTVSPDNRTLTHLEPFGSRLRRWDLATGRDLDPVPDPAPWHWVRFSPDGAELREWVYRDGERRWDAKTGRYLGTRAMIPVPEMGNLWPSETGLTVTTAFVPETKEHAVAVWDTATRRKVADLPPHPREAIQSVLVAPNRDWILVWGAADEKTGYLRRWNLAPVRLAWDVRLPLPQPREVTISADDKTVYLGDWQVQAFDAETGRERFKRTLFDAVPKDWSGQWGYGRNACWLADGRLVRSFPKHGLAITHPETGEFRLMPLADAQALGASPDGKRLAVVGRGEDTTIRVFETEQWTEIWAGRLSSREVEAVRFSPNGRRLIAPSQSPTVQTEVFDLPE